MKVQFNQDDPAEREAVFEKAGKVLREIVPENERETFVAKLNDEFSRAKKAASGGGTVG